MVVQILSVRLDVNSESFPKGEQQSIYKNVLGIIINMRKKSTTKISSSYYLQVCILNHLSRL